ncbi:MAG: aldehyde dehydrogenase (NADP(+)) [Burkholderiaceae bacterium]|nr:aldehyde dehydrogenase (NADP(+)) [Burkholderiaceae bacterium]
MNLTDHTSAQIDATVAAAAAAADTWAASSAATRAALLRGLAEALEAARDTLVPLADRESHLGPARLNGELDRTAFQLRGFATRVEAGDPFAHTDDPAVAGAPPAGHPALLRVRQPLGPVAMFSASNFPFAFSVLGGDTASALAAGCPVIVKGHPAHPALTRATAALAAGVVQAQGLPAGVFGLVEGAAVAVGVHLVQHPAIAAVAFTGSFRGGAALQAVANARPRPIPFFGELGSINPVVARPAVLAAQGPALATTLAGSITLSCGQFCTSPGVIVLLDDPASDRFVDALAAALGDARPHAMLTPGMRANFDAGVARWAATPGVQWRVAPGAPGTGGDAPTPALAVTTAATFIATPALHDEVFGPAALVVRAASTDEAAAVLQAIGGSLTVTLWGADTDDADSRALVRAAMQTAGRVLFSGVPTGVAVTAGQQHGGPWPSSTRAETTSVGWAAMDRFLRPVALQDAPAWLQGLGGQPC